MATKIRFDSTHNIEMPTLVLAKRSGDKLGVIPAVNIINKTTLTSGCEVSFKVYKFNDGIRTALWDEIVDFKLLYCPEWNEWYEIYVDIDETNETVKNIQAVSLGIAELSQINLYGIEINTEDDIDGADFEQYGKSVLYSEENPKISILHRILKDKAPHYHIGHIDNTLIKETEGRLVQFSFDNISIYDALQEIAQEINALLVVDTSAIDSSVDRLGDISRTISFYDLEENCANCGHRGDFKHTCPKCGATGGFISEGYGNDTNIFISSDNLSDSISYSTDKDAVKNCFKLEAGDEYMTDTIRNCNANGSGYIWYISDELKKEMSPELVAALDAYDTLYDEYQNTHQYSFNTTAYNGLVSKYQQWNNKLTNIPSDIIGHPAVMTAYYNVLDLYQYLAHSLMPNVEMEETNAQAEISKVRTELTSKGVSLRSYTQHTSDSTIESAIKNVVGVIASPNYKVSVSTISTTFNADNTTGSWTGSITLTRYYEDENDPEATITLTVSLNANDEAYYRQLIDKKVSQTATENTYGAEALFKIDTSGDTLTAQAQFRAELAKYNLASLNEFQTICEAILNILTEQGVADPTQWNDVTGTENLYNKLYLPYYNRSTYIENEITLRESELKILDNLNGEINEAHSDTTQALNFDNFLKTIGESVWVEFCSFRREDTYSNSNYISDGLNNAELFAQALHFIEIAKKEIFKSATLQHSIQASLYNLLVMKEFLPLVDNFKVGNWLRLQVDDNVYKLRLVEYEIDFENLDDISVTFSDVTTGYDGYSDIENIINSAKSISSTYQSVQRQADAGDRTRQQLQHWFTDGLSVASVRLQSDSIDQTQSWDENGMLFRRVIPETEEYDDIQMKIINSTLAITNDNWRSVKAAVGRFSYKDMADGGVWKDGYGINAEVLCGRLILGETLAIYNNTATEDNSLTFDSNGLIVTGNNNTVRINANPTSGEYNNSIFTITRNNGDNEQTLISFDNNGYGLIGGWTISDASISKAGVLPDGKNYNVSMNAVPYSAGESVPYNPMFGIIYDNDWKFYVRSNGQLYAKNADISGRITASSGEISGNLTIGGSLSSTQNGYSVTMRGVQSDTSWGVFFITDHSTNTYPFRINGNGSVSMSNATITGGSFNINNNFKVNTSGTMTANNVVIKNNLYLTMDESTNIRALRIDTDGVALGRAGDYGANTYIYGDSIWLHSGNINFEGLAYFDRTPQSTYSFVVGDGGNSWNAGILTPFKGDTDEQRHYILCREDDGLTVYVGTNGSVLNKTSNGNSRTTTLSLHGDTVKLSTASSVTSDERLKTDFINLDKYRNFYLGLQPYAFKYTYGNSGRFHIGFKAQQVESELIQAGLSTDDFAGFILRDVNPNSEDYHGYDKEYGLRYDEFIALNTYMIQQAWSRIDELEAELKELKG